MHTKTRVLALLSTVLAGSTFAAAFFMSGIKAADPTGAPAPLSPELLASKSLYSDRCSACHALPDPVAKAYNREQWQRTVDRMINKYKADITPDDAAKIVDYLATFTPANNAAGPVDPWAASIDDVWRTMPTATQVFTFTGPTALNGLNPVAAGIAGPLPHWHSASGGDGTTGITVDLPSPSPDRFALLVNRGATPKNLDIRTRFEIAGGHLSPAIGIVFGYVDATHYYVVRYSAQQDNLSLIKIDGETHTTLQQTPRILVDPAAATTTAPGTPAAPVAAPSPTSGWHVLRVQVNNNSIRAWIDRSKRINIPDSSYVGGKVGLWSQGDTNATFNNWIIDQYDNEPLASS